MTLYPQLQNTSSPSPSSSSSLSSLSKKSTCKNEFRLFAICEPRSTFQLKNLFKSYSLFSKNHNLRKGTDLCKVPLNITKILLDHGRETEEDEGFISADVIDIDGLPPAILQSDQILGFEWIKDDRLRSRANASPIVQALQEFRSITLHNSCSRKIDQELVGIDRLPIPGYEAYNQLVIFQSKAFESQDWNRGVFNDCEFRRQEFYSILAKKFGVSHLASKGFIERDDPVRNPRLRLIYGEFDRVDDRDGFESSFWTWTNFYVPARGRSIRYVWSPTHTMYCRGNSSEKIRISSTLGDLEDKVVVDMFSGIGFFSFCYLVGGAKKVIGCEISRWAVEGLRRGSIENGFGHAIIKEEGGGGEKSEDEFLFSSETETKFKGAMDDPRIGLIILPYSNQIGSKLFRGLADHVNLGLLPDSIPFIPTSILALKPESGGHLHIHTELDLLKGGDGTGFDEDPRWKAKRFGEDLMEKIRWLEKFEIKDVKDEGVHFVKLIRPKMYHVVFQIRIGPFSILDENL